MKGSSFSTNELHVIFGTGPAGCWIARALTAMGIAVRAVNRSGKRPDLLPDKVELVSADILDSAQAVRAAQGAATVYQALNPPFHQYAKQFPVLQKNAIDAASAAGARYISIENLYLLNPSGPITDSSPIVPRSEKGKLRARMANDVMIANRNGVVRAAAIRSSDYYGPGVIISPLGENIFGNLVSGKKAQIFGTAGKPHSWAYIEDVGQAAAILGTSEDVFGKAWIIPHAPACSQRFIIEATWGILGDEPLVSFASPSMLRLTGLFNPHARTSAEIMDEFIDDFTVKSNRFQRTFGLEPTPIDFGIVQTIRWFKKRLQAE